MVPVDFAFPTGSPNFQVDSRILIPGLEQPCYTAAVEVSFRMTSTDLAASALVVRLNHNLGSASVISPPLGSITGTQMGSSCGSLVFKDGSPAFSTAVPPYDGSFSAGDSLDAKFLNLTPSAWGLHLQLFPSGSSLPPSTLQCWTIRVTLSSVPVGF